MPKTTSIKFDKLSTARVLSNLNKAIKKLEKRSLAGLIDAGMYIKAQAARITPLLLSNLRNSAYVTWAGADIAHTSFDGVDAPKLMTDHTQVITGVQLGRTGHKEPWVAVGNTASYAIYVHEMNKNYTIGHWKFLSMTIEENKKFILKLIAKEARIK